MEVLEIGFKLNNSLIYYHNLLTKNGLCLDFSCITHDIYYTNKILDGLTEAQMKKSCIRLRNCTVINQKNSSNCEFSDKEKELKSKGYHKIFDTIKIDFQYSNKKLKSKIQLQEIKDIGLVVYYDNPDYSKLDLKEQRKKLIDELNSYGFNFQYNELGIDKLRTLYYKKEMYSENQNS